MDGLRAVAAALVVLTHVGFLTGAVSFGLVGRLLGRGDLGVAIFFALSGFLLYAAMQREWTRTGGLRVRSYYLRRTARVLPAFWLGLVVVAVAVRPGSGVLAANLTLTHIYFPDALLDGYTQTWSLATEASFYLVLPAVFLWLHRGGRARTGAEAIRGGSPEVLPVLPVLGATWGLGVLAAALPGLLVIGGEELAGRWLPAHWASFALGMVLAQVRSEGSGRVHRFLSDLADHPGTCLTVSAGAYLLATTTIAGPLTLGPVSGLQLAGKSVLATVVAGGLMVPLLFGRSASAYRSALSSSPARFAGRISYGIFLWHLPVFEGIYAVTGISYFSGGALALLSVGLPVTIGLAALTERFVERPLMQRVHHRSR